MSAGGDKNTPNTPKPKTKHAPASKQVVENKVAETTLKPPSILLVYEAHALNHRWQGVNIIFGKQTTFGKNGTLIRMRQRPEEKQPSGKPITLGSVPVAVPPLTDKEERECVTERRGLFERKNPSDTDEITPDSVQHKTAFWPTERLRLQHRFHTKAADFDAARNTDAQEKEPYVNKVLVLINSDTGEVKSCYVDGVEVQVEHLAW